MRPSLSLSLLTSLLACLASADSVKGKLYIYDSQLQSPPSSSADTTTTTTTIDANTARLVIAARLGLDQYHDLGDLDESAISAINQLTAPQPLSDHAHLSPAVALLVGVGLDHEVIPSAPASHTLHMAHIDNMPSLKTTRDFTADLASQSGKHSNPSTFKIAKDQHHFLSTLETLLRQDYTVLALTIPNHSTSKHTYGKYTNPPALHKRANPLQEAPLITESPLPILDDSTTLISMAKNYSGPLKGILPQCYSSKSECESITRNCTGHGSCSLKYTNKDAQPAAACYSCACSATVVTRDDGGKKTTNWGGPACQKKDIVMPFWLLAGFSVVMVSLVSWAIGMLMTMGNQDLPSVIGAGVSGKPRSN